MTRGDKMVCVCNLCYPNAVEYCELIPDCWLFENEGKWGLMCQPGHKDDHAILMFPDKPWPDPDIECEHEDDEIAALNDKWIDTVSDWSDIVKMCPGDGHFLVEACKKAGWDHGKTEGTHNFMLFWLYDFAGKKLLEGDNAQSGNTGIQPANADGVGCDNVGGGEPATQVESTVVDGGPTGSDELGGRADGVGV